MLGSALLNCIESQRLGASGGVAPKSHTMSPATATQRCPSAVSTHCALPARAQAFTRSLLPAAPQKARLVAAGASKGGDKVGLGDELLDFMYAGKKLRKWYGEEGMVLPRDGGPPPEPSGQEPEAEEEEDGPLEGVVVLGAETDATAELLVLQLILARTKTRVLVKDVAAARAGFGSYIQALQGDASDSAALKRALKGAAAVVITGRPGGALAAAAAARVPHIVLLTATASRGGGLLSLMGGGEGAVLADASREAAVRASGLTYTIVQVPSIVDRPGGASALVAGPARGAGGSSGSSSNEEAVSREDAAEALAAAATRDLSAGSLALRLASAGPGEPPASWEDLFRQVQRAL